MLLESLAKTAGIQIRNRISCLASMREARRVGAGLPLGHETIVSECSVLSWLERVYLSRAGNCILTWICRMSAGEGLIWLGGWRREEDQGGEQSVLDHRGACGHPQLGRDQNFLKGHKTKQGTWAEDSSKVVFSRWEEIGHCWSHPEGSRAPTAKLGPPYSLTVGTDSVMVLRRK